VFSLLLKKQVLGRFEENGIKNKTKLIILGVWPYCLICPTRQNNAVFELNEQVN
jgi:hypothetical protein